VKDRVQGKYDLDTLRHSTSHIMAQAVKRVFPEAKLGIGPAIKDGFYYDFEIDGTVLSQNLSRIKKEMLRIIKEDLPIKREIVDKEEAKKIFRERNEPYKLELLEEMDKGGITLYRQAEFVDLCRGPHIKRTGELKFFQLLSIAGSYWRGEEKNPMLSRLYGTSFFQEKELKEYLKRIEEVKKRDHRKLGKALDLYSISEEVGSGLVLWHPKGAKIRQVIEEFWKEEHQKRGYEYVYSPHIGKIGLWQKSGHWDFYREMMYSPMEMEGVQYLLKPMSCPFHVQIYKTKIRSYRDLPLRWCELGTVYRYEKQGVLRGLLRVRGFTQDDAHIFCLPEQLGQEVENILDLAIFMLSSFGFKEFDIDLSLRDPQNKAKYLGDDEIWERAESVLAEALNGRKLKYRRVLGEAVFYGPKIDIRLIDALKRGWQGPTIQIDFNFPQKFDLNYIDKHGRKQKVVMIHRTVLGAMERFVGNLIEHYAGALPIWLSPVQIKILTVTQKEESFANEVYQRILEEGIRTQLNVSQKMLGYKIREAQLEKVPYMLIIGAKEAKEKLVTARKRNGENLKGIKLEDFLPIIKDEIRSRM